jgi:hypothetical protein
MKMPFEDLSDESKESQKLSLIEKAIIAAAALLAKAIIWKLKKAKTYGDLHMLGNYLENRSDTLGDIIDNSDDDPKSMITSVLKEAGNVTEEIKNL